jgi:hypothetical protein
MGMSIQEILAAQQRAVKATCKRQTPLVRKPAAGQTPNSVQDLIKAQQATVNATRKVIVPQSPAIQARAASVAELVERQRITVAAQKAATSGLSPVLSADQKAVIDSIRERYKTFLDKLDKELAGQELFMAPPATVSAEEKPAEPIFAPNVSASEDLVVEAAQAPAGVNGISVGEELGGQVAIAVRPKRKRKAKAVNQESEPTDETPAVEA